MRGQERIFEALQLRPIALTSSFDIEMGIATTQRLSTVREARDA